MDPIAQKRAKVFEIVSMLVATIAAIVLCVMMLGCNAEANGENPEKELPEITGITVVSKTYDYDGHAHGIELSGALSTDKIYYSTNGREWKETKIEKTEVGEYAVYYKVVRSGYADYVGMEVLTITRPGIPGVLVCDIICISGKQIIPNITGLQEDDEIKYSINESEYIEQIEITTVGVYTVSYKIIRPSVGISEGAFTLTVLPNISGTYIANGERVILTDTTAILSGEEYNITYGTDGNGYVEINGKAVEFSVRDNVLTINENEYIKIEESSNTLELRVNNKIYYAAAENTANVKITFKNNIATVKVKGITVAEISGYNYCESVLGGEEIKRDYLTGSIEFTVPSGFADITLSLLNDEAVEKIEDSIVLYDGTPHIVETYYEDVLYLNDGEYEQQPRAYTEAGEYDYTVVVMRRGYLPCVLVTKLIILPDMSGVYVADGVGVVEIDGLNAKMNNCDVTFEHGLNSGLIDGAEVEYGNGTITLNAVEYIKTNENILAFMIGERIKVFNRDVDYALRIDEGEENTTVSIMRYSLTGESFNYETAGRNSVIMLDGVELIPDAYADDEIYYLVQADLGDARIVWVVVATE